MKGNAICIREARCQCLACFGFRLAARIFLIGLLCLMLFGLFARGDQADAVLIDSKTAGPIVRDASNQDLSDDDGTVLMLCPIKPASLHRDRDEVEQV